MIIGGYSKSAAFTVCKKLLKERTVKHILWVGRPERFMNIFEGHVTLPVFRASDAGPYLGFCWQLICKILCP